MTNARSTNRADKQLVIFPRGTLDKKTKEQLSKNGFLGIEAENPAAVVTVLPFAPLASNLQGDDIVQAMVRAINKNDWTKNALGKELSDLLMKNLEKKP